MRFAKGCGIWGACRCHQCVFGVALKLDVRPTVEDAVRLYEEYYRSYGVKGESRPRVVTSF